MPAMHKPTDLAPPKAILRPRLNTTPNGAACEYAVGLPNPVFRFNANTTLFPAFTLAFSLTRFGIITTIESYNYPSCLRNPTREFW